MEAPAASDGEEGEEGEEERFTLDEQIMIVAYIAAGLLGLAIVAYMNTYRKKKVESPPSSN